MIRFLCAITEPKSQPLPIPLSVPFQVLYSRIAITLWQSSRQLDYCIPMQNVAPTSSAGGPVGETGNKIGQRNNGQSAGTVAVTVEHTEDVPLGTARSSGPNGSLFPPLRRDSGTSGNSDIHNCQLQQQQQQQGPDNSNMFVQHKMVPIPQSSYNILRARRGVIRMLIVVVLTFALCNLPFHARKIWQYW